MNCLWPAACNSSSVAGPESCAAACDLPSVSASAKGNSTPHCDCSNPGKQAKQNLAGNAMADVTVRYVCENQVAVDLGFGTRGSIPDSYPGVLRT